MESEALTRGKEVIEHSCFKRNCSPPSFSRKSKWIAAVLFALPSLGAAQSSGAARAPLPALSETSGWNWADVKEQRSYSAEFAATKAICARVRGLEPPETDWPDAASAAKLKDCDSEALYYGIGMPAAPVQARQCALLETRNADDNRWPFSGTAMLMTMYANGVGAERNLDLATSLACRIEGAPFAVHSRVEHLQKLAAEHDNQHDFDYCDDISSGMAGGLCAVHAASIADDQRSDKIDALSRAWTVDERVGLKHVLTAMETYATASGENEVDLSGTGRVGFIKDREYEVKEDWMRLLDALQSSNCPVSSSADYHRADADLNRVYRQIMAIKPDADGHINDGTVLQHDIHATQRIWLRYRDAWVAFAAVKYPQVSAASLKTELTRKRTDFLRDFVPKN